MNASAEWHASNARFLSREVARIRARLIALLPTQSSPSSEYSADLLPLAAEANIDSQFTSALEQLAQVLDLSAFERDVLLLCVATALDTGLASLCAAVNGDRAKPYPTFALAMRLSDDPSWDALTPSGGLRHWRLIEIHQAGSEPISNSALRADEKIVNYIKGLNHVDDRIECWISPVSTDVAGPLTDSQSLACNSILPFVLEEQKRGRSSLVQLLGPTSEGKKVVASYVSNALGLVLWRLRAASLPDLAGEKENFARLLLRESILFGAALYLDCDETVSASDHGAASLLAWFIDRLDGMLIFQASRDPSPSADRAILVQPVGKPTASEQRGVWLRLLGPEQEATANLLAGQFNLDLAAIERIAARPRGAMDTDTETRLWQDAREAVRPRVMGLAERIDARSDWRDIVLPQPQIVLLTELAAQVRNQWIVNELWGFARRANRGLGIGAMFCGGSGTGKTMAAEVVARAVKLDLYRIDLASVVSKYIGETEKNLRQVFDAFEDGGAILFFDEADALFGKRSDVKDSHDRYANIEINYLLQRMEAYRGLVILATNRRSAMDHAFARRLRFIIDFPYPGPAERQAIWQQVFPPDVPRAELDLQRLSRLPLSGGNIQSVALNAAFRAADEGSDVNMDLILSCARAELLKLEVPINEADFRPHRDIRRSA